MDTYPPGSRVLLLACAALLGGVALHGIDHAHSYVLALATAAAGVAVAAVAAISTVARPRGA